MAQPFKLPTSGVFYLRRRVPDELRQALGRGYKRSLSTRDPSEAKARFALEWSKSEEAFSLARAQLSGVEGLSTRDVQQLAARWFRSQLDAMERTGEFNTYLVPGSIIGWETCYGWKQHQEMLSIQQSIEEGDETDWCAKARANIRKALKAEGIPIPLRDRKHSTIWNSRFTPTY